MKYSLDDEGKVQTARKYADGNDEARTSIVERK